jgi:hypothetical protein
MFIPDLGSRIRIFPFRILDPGSGVKKIPDPGYGSTFKNLSIFNPKNCFYALGNMIRDVLWILIFLPIPDPGSRDQKGTGSGIRIRNTEDRARTFYANSIYNLVQSVVY